MMSKPKEAQSSAVFEVFSKESTQGMSLMQPDEGTEDMIPHPLMNHDPTENNNELYDMILVAYYKFKHLLLCDQPEMEKLRWNTISKQKKLVQAKKQEKLQMILTSQTSRT
eukprot:11041232-Ditylum_brightwellii.AAC.1